MSDTPSNRFDSSLIQKPQLQPRVQRTFWGVVTLTLWGVYLYLWAPAVTLLSWIFGGRLAWLHLYHYKQELDPFIITVLPLLLICAAVVLIIWAEYNRMRFSGKDRRRAQPPISQALVAQDFGVDIELSNRILASKNVTLHMDEHAHPTAMSERIENLAS